MNESGATPPPSEPAGQAEAERRERDRSGDWRTAETFNQGERYEGAPPDRSLAPLYALGFAMIGVTIVALLFGAPSWAAFLLGLAAFAGGVYWLGLRGSPDTARAAAPSWRERLSEAGAAATRKPRVAATAAGIDPRDLEERLDRAEADLVAIDRLAAHPVIQPVAAELKAVTEAGRRVLDHLAGDPADLPRAQKYLRVYLPSAREALRKFADLGVRDGGLTERLRAVASDMETTSLRVLDALKSDERVALEVELDVLSDRLRAETR